jgi:hypothetical protein
LLLEDRVLADVGRDHLSDLPGLQQDAQAKVVDPAVVRDHDEVLDPQVADRVDAVFRDAAQPESAGQDGHSVPQPGSGQGVLCVGYDFVHGCETPMAVPADVGFFFR